jgi:hypothetical protein
MLNRFYVLNNEPDKQAIIGRKAAAADITVVHMVDDCAGQLLPLVIHQFGPEGNYPFSLALRITNAAAMVFPDKLLLLFFHPFYENTDGGKLLFIYVAAEDKEGVRGQLEALFEQQRLEVELVFPDEHTECATKGGAVVRTLPGGAIDPTAYYRYCLTSYCPRDIFFLGSAGGPATGGSERATTLIPDLQDVEADLRQTNPVFHRLAAEHAAIHKAWTDLTRENTQLREEAAILRQLLELSNKHAEVDYILRFYKYEYEILPLWYKRFGHIIKVLQGKRSFRSLYDKKVKKYKD